MGAAEFIDWGGVDIVYYAGNYLAEALDSPRHKPPPEVDEMMKNGHKGLREGKGYYDYTKIDVEAYKREKLSEHLAATRDRIDAWIDAKETVPPDIQPLIAVWLDKSTDDLFTDTTPSKR